MNYKLNEAKMFADISDGMAIIINSATGVYYGMNGYGTDLFENLLAGSSEEELISSIKALPGVTENAVSSFEEFINTMSRFDIIIPADPASGRPAVLNATVAAAEGFQPLCNEYKDAQEHLFADPIHEVDENTGWKPGV